MRSKGLQQINRNAPTGYGEAPDLLKGKVEGFGFVIYPRDYDPREVTHTLSSTRPHLRQPLLRNFKPLLMEFFDMIISQYGSVHRCAEKAGNK